MKLLYRTSEAKAALGVGTTTLYRWINEGRLDARKMGRRTYITGDSIEALVESLENDGMTVALAPSSRRAR